MHAVSPQRNVSYAIPSSATHIPHIHTQEGNNERDDGLPGSIGHIVFAVAGQTLCQCILSEVITQCRVKGRAEKFTDPSRRRLLSYTDRIIPSIPSPVHDQTRQTIIDSSQRAQRMSVVSRHYCNNISMHTAIQPRNLCHSTKICSATMWKSSASATGNIFTSISYG